MAFRKTPSNAPTESKSQAEMEKKLGSIYVVSGAYLQTAMQSISKKEKETLQKKLIPTFSKTLGSILEELTPEVINSFDFFQTAIMLAVQSGCPEITNLVLAKASHLSLLAAGAVGTGPMGDAILIKKLGEKGLKFFASPRKVAREQFMTAIQTRCSSLNNPPSSKEIYRTMYVTHCMLDTAKVQDVELIMTFAALLRKPDAVAAMLDIIKNENVSKGEPAEKILILDQVVRACDAHCDKSTRQSLLEDNLVHAAIFNRIRSVESLLKASDIDVDAKHILWFAKGEQGFTCRTTLSPLIAAAAG